jgi:CheY-like chemotaxis protein
MNATPEGMVLLVDDDASTLSALRRLLRKERYAVATTLDPREALASVERGEVRVLVSDQRMPAMAGSDVLRRAYEASPGTYRVLLTAYPDAEVIALRESGVIQRLVTKPWTDRELRGLLRELMEGGGRGGDCELRVDGNVLRLRCTGAGVDDAIERIAGWMWHPEARASGAVVVLEGAMQAGRGAMRLLRGLARAARIWGVPTYVVDASGLALRCAPAPLLPARNERDARWLLAMRRAGGY